MVEQGSDGQPIILYRKNFKLGGWNVWSDRENRFLNLFSGWRLQHVVQPHQLTANSPGGVFNTVDTHDAGLTIEEWLQVAAHYADGNTYSHPFRRGEDFLRLMRACLAALQEIHERGVVHCDIKQDNICLPWTPSPYLPGVPLKPDFAELRLIDFSFSLSRDLPLAQPLPIEPSADYQSPLLKTALKADRSHGRSDKTAQLDYRVDLFGLGHMGRQIMDGSSFVWEPEERGASGKALMREVMDDLLALGSGKTPLRHVLGRPHQRLIGKLDLWLRDAREQDAFVPIARTVPPGAARVTPVTPSMETPVTPVVTPVPDQVKPPDPDIPAPANPVKDTPGAAAEQGKAAALAVLTALGLLTGGGYWWYANGADEHLVKTTEPPGGAASPNKPVPATPKPPAPVKPVTPPTPVKPAPSEKPAQPPVSQRSADEKPAPPPLAQRAAALADELAAATGGDAEYLRLLKRRALAAGEEQALAGKALGTLKANWFSTARDAATARHREASLAPLLWLLARQPASEQAGLRAELGARYWQDSNAGPMQAEWWTARGPRPADAAGQSWLRQTTLLARAGIFSARVALAEARYAGKGQSVDIAGAATTLSAALQSLSSTALSDKGTAGALKDAMELTKLGLRRGDAFATAIRPGLEHLESLGHANGRFLLAGLLACRAADTANARRVYVALAKDAEAAGAAEYAARVADARNFIDANDRAGLCAWLGMKL